MVITRASRCAAKAGIGVLLTTVVCVPSQVRTVARPMAAYPFDLPKIIDAPCVYCITPVYACTELTVYENDSRESAATYKLAVGDSVSMRDGRMHVHRPDRIIVQRDWYDQESGTRFLAGDTIYGFTYGIEGTAGTWYAHGAFHESDNVWMQAVNLEMGADRADGIVAINLQDGIRQWWMLVSNQQARTGWVPYERGSVVFADYYNPQVPECGTRASD